MCQDVQVAVLFFIALIDDSLPKPGDKTTVKPTLSSFQGCLDRAGVYGS